MQLKPYIAISTSGLIFNPETGESFVVNNIGLDILKLVKNGKSKTEIALELLSVYDVSPEFLSLTNPERLNPNFRAFPVNALFTCASWGL